MNIRASSLHRAALCPGSVTAEAGLPGKSSPDAERGKRVHKAWQASVHGEFLLDGICKNDAEWEAAEALTRRTKFLIAQFGGLRPGGRIRTEVRLTGDGITGTTDMVADCEQATLLVDGKSGWADYTPAEENAQLRAYAVMLYEKEQPDRLAVALVSPGSQTVTEYGPTEIDQAKAEIAEIHTAAADPDAPRIPNEYACAYCKALATGRCPESCQTPERITEAIDKAAENLPAEKVSQLLDLAAAADAAIKRIREEAKERLAAGDEIPGWELKPGANRRTIPDAGNALGLPLPESEVYACMSAQPGKLETALKKKFQAEGLKAGEAKAKAKDTLDPIVETAQGSPQLKRKAGWED